MSDPALWRYRLAFSKTQAMRYTGHLDLYRALERSIRRAALPLAYSRGFSPHPKLQLASALPLGFTSRAEIADLWLEQAIPEAEVLARLQRAAPPGISFDRLEPVLRPEPTLQQQVRAATFVVSLHDAAPPDLHQRLATLLGAGSVIRQRRGRSYDLRPLIDAIQVREGAQLVLTLSAKEGATGRPEEVLEALGLDPLASDIERTGLDIVAQAAPQRSSLPAS